MEDVQIYLGITKMYRAFIFFFIIFMFYFLFKFIKIYKNDLE